MTIQVAGVGGGVGVSSVVTGLELLGFEADDRGAVDKVFPASPGDPKFLVCKGTLDSLLKAERLFTFFVDENIVPSVFVVLDGSKPPIAHSANQVAVHLARKTQVFTLPFIYKWRNEQKDSDNAKQWLKALTVATETLNLEKENKVNA